MSLIQLRRTQCRVLWALSEANGRLHTRDLAGRCGLLLNEVRWACRWLAERGLVVETKSLMLQAFGDKTARRPVAFWAMTPAGRELARVASPTTARWRGAGERLQPSG